MIFLCLGGSSGHNGDKVERLGGNRGDCLRALLYILLRFIYILSPFFFSFLALWCF